MKNHSLLMYITSLSAAGIKCRDQKQLKEEGLVIAYGPRRRKSTVAARVGNWLVTYSSTHRHHSLLGDPELCRMGYGERVGHKHISIFIF